MSSEEMICIVCPLGCNLNIYGNGSDYIVEGNKCEKGRAYAIDELINPLRTVTSTVKIKGGFVSRLPVKTDKQFPKGKMYELIEVLNKLEIQSPVKRGKTIIKNVLDTGINIVSTKTVMSILY